MESAVFDEDLVRIHPRDDYAGKIQPGYVTGARFRVALRTAGVRVDAHSGAAQEVEIRMISGQRKNEVIVEARRSALRIPNLN